MSLQERPTVKVTVGQPANDVMLSPITPNDHEFLYHCATSPNNVMSWRYHGQVPPPEAFVAGLYNDVLSQFVVRMGDGTPVGHVVGYAASLKNRHCHVGAVMAETDQQRGVGSRALELFIDHLFQVWDFNGVYAEVPEYTFKKLDDAGTTMGARLPFVETGRRPQFHYHSGQYWDDVIFYLPRLAWETRSSA